MPKDKPEYEFQIKLVGFNERNLELAAEAIYEKLDELPLAGPKTMILKFGGGQALAERMVEIEARLRENRGAEIEITSKRVKPIEENPNASFWDPDQQAKFEADIREEQERRRLANAAFGGSKVSVEGNRITFHEGTVGGASRYIESAADTVSDDLTGDFDDVLAGGRRQKAA